MDYYLHFADKAAADAVLFDAEGLPLDPTLNIDAIGTWYDVDNTDPEDRALIYQVREEVEIVTRFNPSDPGVFDLDVYTWGARARRTAAAGNPRRIFRRTG